MCYCIYLGARVCLYVVCVGRCIRVCARVLASTYGVSRLQM